MHPPRKEADVHWNMLLVRCEQHGTHKVIIAGLDDLADDFARHALEWLTDRGEKGELVSTVIPLTEARMAAAEGSLDVDDLPF